MIYKNEQPRTASLCIGWAMLEKSVDFIFLSFGIMGFIVELWNY